jgi:hypothetical protein
MLPGIWLRQVETTGGRSYFDQAPLTGSDLDRYRKGLIGIVRPTSALTTAFVLAVSCYPACALATRESPACRPAGDRPAMNAIVVINGSGYAR